MARTYSALSGGFTSRLPMKSVDLNNLRTAMDWLASQAGVTITLPAVLTTLYPSADDFQAWLLASRAVVEDFTAAKKCGKYDTGTSTFAPWGDTEAAGDEIKALLTFIHEAWESNTLHSRRVVNVSQGATGAGDTQTGTLSDTILRESTVYLMFAGDTVTNLYQDNGSGQFTALQGPAVTASSIDYETGAWSITTASAMGAGLSTLASYQWGNDVDDWAVYIAGQVNPPCYKYVNEIYYCLECLSYTKHSVSKGTGTTSEKDGSGDDGGGSAGGAWQTVNSNMQSGTMNSPIVPGSVNLYYGDAAMNMWVTDDTAGGWTVVAAYNCNLAAGSIDYDTGEWFIATDATFAAGLDGVISATAGGDKAVAWDEGWDAFEAAAYAGGAGYEAKAISHLYEYMDVWYYLVENDKVTIAPVDIPNVSYAFDEFWIPFRDDNRVLPPNRTIGASKGAATLEGAFDGSYVWRGWFVLSGASFDNETVDLDYQYDEIDRNHWGTVLSAHDWNISMGIDGWRSGSGNIDCYGHSQLDGYCNGEYDPLN